MTLPARRYKDPAIQLEEKESGSCRGCKHFVEQRVFDVSYMACLLDCKKHWLESWQSKRCKKYAAK